MMRGLFIGIGGTGDEILTRLKDRVIASVGSIPDTVQFRLIDTQSPDPRAWQGNDNAEVALRGHEYLQLVDQPQGTLFAKTAEIAALPEHFPEIAPWYRARLFVKHVPRDRFDSTRGGAQYRQFARMVLFLNRQRIFNMLRTAIEDCGVGTGRLPIWIVGSVAGGTGAGLFLDVALLTGWVLDQKGSNAHLIGAPVLPDVFWNRQGILRQGIDLARAYALLRELERFQAPVPTTYQGNVGRTGVTLSRFSVRYDADTEVHLDSTLFENLVFYNRPCASEEERESYFAEIADGLNLLLDPALGDAIFRTWTHARPGYATSFNARRIYIPIRLYERQFVLQAALAVANGLLPRDPKTNVPLADSDDDRMKDAQQIIGAQLPEHVRYLHEPANKPTSERERNERSARMDPTFIVNDLLGFNNPEGNFRGAIGEDLKDAARRLYAPLTTGIQSAKDVQENFQDSKLRIKNEVINRRRDYEGDGSASFKVALAAIRPLVVEHLATSIGDSVRHYLIRQRANDKALGKTRRVLTELAPLLDAARTTLDRMVTGDADAKAQVKCNEDKALTELNAFQKPKLFPWRGPLAEAENDYLTAIDAVTRCVQREHLVTLLRELIDVAKGQVGAWLESLNGWEKTIQQVVQQATEENNQITQCLERQRGDGVSASMGMNNVPDMDGYRDWLRRMCLLNPDTNRPLTDDLMGGLVWRPGDRPEDLVLDNWPSTVATLVPGDFPRRLIDDLAAAIGARIGEFEGMTNYLKWLRDDNGHPPVPLAVTHLNTVTQPFLDEKATSPTRRALLLYGDTWNAVTDGPNAFNAIYQAVNNNDAIPDGQLQNNLYAADGGIPLLKDKNVLAVLMVDNQIPYRNVPVFEAMRQAYLAVRNEPPSQDRWEPETYHLFACDQEAWRVEHDWVQKTGDNRFPEIPGQFTRLLDDPGRVKLFCTALALGVIRKQSLSIGGSVYVCGPPNSDDPRDLIYLNDPDADDTEEDQAQERDPHDLLRALVTFVMDQKDRRLGRAGNLDARKIEGWMQIALTGLSQTLEQAVTQFAAANPALFEVRLVGPEQAPEINFLALIMNHYLRLVEAPVPDRNGS